MNTTDQLLADILEELRGMRSDIQAISQSVTTLEDAADNITGPLGYSIQDVIEHITGPLGYSLSDLADQITGATRYNLEDANNSINALESALNERAIGRTPFQLGRPGTPRLSSACFPFVEAADCPLRSCALGYGGSLLHVLQDRDHGRCFFEVEHA